jgi:fibronectin-binding autotransporter adhesin
MRSLLHISGAVLAACAWIASSQPATAQSVTWIGSGTNLNWSTAANWTTSGSAGLWASGTGVHVTIGSVAGSGTSFQNRTDYLGGVQIGRLTLASPTPFAVTGTAIYLNGPITSTGAADRAVTAQLNLQQPNATIEVATGSGRLTLGNITSSTVATTLRKTGAGELLLSGRWMSGSATTFTIEEGTVSLAAEARQGFSAPPANVALGMSGNGRFTAGVLRLAGGNLRAAVVASATLGPQYYIAPVTQDTILSGANVNLGDPTGAMNARLQFSGSTRIDSITRLTVHNESIFTRHISGWSALTVAGTGRLSLQGSGSTPTMRLVMVTVDGGGIGVTSSALAGLPSQGITLTNGGRLDSLSGFTIGGTNSTQKITLGAGGGVLRSASPMNAADMIIQTGGLQGSGTLRIEATQPLLPPNMPAGSFVQPGRIVLAGTNSAFTGNTVVAGGELQVRSLGGLGTALLAGGTQAVDVQAGILNVVAAPGTTLAPDLSRVTVNKAATLRLSSSSGWGTTFSVTPSTVPVAPIAGTLGLEGATLSGSTATLRLANGAMVRNSGTLSGSASLRTNLAYASAESGTITLAGTYIPNRRASWGGELLVNGQLTREAGAGAFDLRIMGAGVVMAVAQNTFTGTTTIDNGRLVLQHVNGLGGPGRMVTIKAGAQLDLATTITSATSLPTLHPDSAGMIALGSGVSNAVVQAMNRGANSIGPGYTSDYTYSLSSLPAVDGVYRFGSVSLTSGGSSTMQIPRSFTITQANVLTGTAAVVVGAAKGDAFGSAGSVLTLRANQDYSGGTQVRKDFFLAIDQPLTSPFGTGPVVVSGVLMATGSAGSFVNVAGLTSQVTFAKGGELWLNNASGVNSDRWSDSTPIALDFGAIRMAGRPSQAASETVGALSYAGGSRIYLENTGTSTSTTLTIQSLAAQAATRPTLELFTTSTSQRVFVTETPVTAGSANLIPGGIDRRNTTFLAWDPATTELVAATPTVMNSFATSNATTFVSINFPTTLSASGTALAVRTTTTISRSIALPSLTIGDGSIGQLMVATGMVTISPDIRFAGAGVIFTGSGARATLTGLVTATNGVVKLGPGDLVLSNTAAVGGVGSQTLVVREGRLSGNGSRAWNVVVEGNGIFAPGNSPDISEVGGLVMGADTRYEFELTALDAVSDKIVVAGDLTLGGFIDIIDWEVDGLGTMEVGTYDLITWGGNLIDNGVTLGDLPEGFFGSLNLNLERKVLEFQVFSALVVVPEPT